MLEEKKLIVAVLMKSLLEKELVQERLWFGLELVWSRCKRFVEKELRKLDFELKKLEEQVKEKELKLL